MEELHEEESELILRRQFFLQIVEILFEQRLLREDEKNRMRIMLVQMSGGIRGVSWNEQ